MNTLILDCSAGMSVYLISDKKENCKIDLNQKKHTDFLLCEVDKMLSDFNLQISDIDNICVCVGPGSFTGIRVAVSICKGIAIGTNAKIFTCSNFDSISYGTQEDSIFLLEAFSDLVYVREKCGGKVKDYSEHFDYVLKTIRQYKNVYVQNEKLQNLLKNNEIQSKIAQNHTKEVFLDKIKNNDFTNINEIEPVYLRLSQAEIERNKKISGEKNG